MSYEAELISKLIKEKDEKVLKVMLKKVWEAGVNSDNLMTHSAEFKKVMLHYRKHSKMPSKATMIKLCPEFSMEKTREPVNFYLDEIVKAQVYEGLTVMNEKALDLMQKDKPVEAANFLLAESRKITVRTNTSDDMDLTQDVVTRLKLYEQRRKQGIVNGIPCGWAPIDKETTGFHKGEFTLLIGRMGSFKCVSGELDARTSQGEIITLKEFIERGEKYIHSLNEKTGKMGLARVAKGVYTGKKPGYKVTTSLGRETIVSSIHPYLTDEGWKKVKDINVGERIALPSKYSFGFTKKVEWDKAYFLGLMLSEGCNSKGEPIFASGNQETIQWAKDFAVTKGIKLNKYSHFSWRFTGESIKKGNVALDWLREFGLYKCKAEGKKIPSDAMRWGLLSKAVLVKALFDGDGSVTKNGKEISYVTVSKIMAKQIVSVLLEFGIVSSCRFFLNSKQGFYQLRINSAYVDVFKRRIPPLIFEKATKIRSNTFTYSDNVCLPFFLLRIIKNRIAEYGPKKFGEKLGWKGKFSLSGFYGGKHLIGKKQLRKYVTILKKLLPKDAYEQINYYINREVYMDKIVSIEKVGYIDMYDLEIEGTHNFVVGDTLVHNTWVMIAWALWAWEQGYNVIFITKEMGKFQIARRFDALATLMRFKDLKTGMIKKKRFADFKKKMVKIWKKADNRLTIIGTAGVTGYGPEFVRSKIDEHRPDIVFIDGLYLMSTPHKTRADWEKHMYISQGTKSCAFDTMTPVVGSTQVGRGAAGKNKQASELHHIAYSDAYAQDSDNVIALNRQRDKIKDTWSNTIEAEILKIREGENITVPVEVDLNKMTFNEKDIKQLDKDAGVPEDDDEYQIEEENTKPLL